MGSIRTMPRTDRSSPVDLMHNRRLRDATQAGTVVRCALARCLDTPPFLSSYDSRIRDIISCPPLVAGVKSVVVSNLDILVSLPVSLRCGLAPDSESESDWLLHRDCVLTGF